MSTETTSPVRTRTLLPSLAGASAIALAVYQVATPGPPGATFDTVLDWVRELLFVTYLVTSVLAVHLAARSGLASVTAARLLTLSYGAIGVGVLYGMATRDDPDWFFVLAGPGNLLAVVAFVLWGVWGFRRRVLPGWAAVMCAAGGAVSVLGAEFGTSVVVGGFWLYLASRLSSAARGRSSQTKS